jgi:hypothetical protein
MRRALLVGLAAAVFAAGAAMAQTSQYVVTVRKAAPVKAFDKIKVERAALGSSEIVIWGNSQLDPDCTEHPGATLSALEQPQHGTLRIVHEDGYTNYAPGNPRSVCNSRKTPVNHAYYTAAAGYAGHDKVVLQGSSSEGTVREITVDILVR